LVKEEIKKEIKDIFQFNENECTTYCNLQNTMKAVVRGKLSSECLQKETGESTH
jgi:ribosomal protein L23